MAYYKSNSISDQTLKMVYLIGTIASVIGLIIVFIQIAALRSLSNLTKTIAEETRERIVFFINASDIAKILKLTHEIQNYNRLKKFELSLLRMQDLKYGLIQIKNHEPFKDMINEKNFSGHLSSLAVDISSTEKQLNNPSSTLNIARLNETLEKVSSDLCDLDTKLKQIGGTYVNPR